MPEFWVDTNVLIHAKNGPLAFDIAPRFWAELDTHIASGQVAIPMQVFEELTNEFDDELSEWAQRRKLTHFTAQSDAAIERYAQISEHVAARYAPYFVRKFMRGADPWLIAHAWATQGRVVTDEEFKEEPLPQPASGQIRTNIKIPNICQQLDVATATLPDMLRELGVTLG